MKDQGKTAQRRRELVGRNAFPPFKRNQIRWALHCYRWKEGISWEKYPYVIASALGIRELARLIHEAAARSGFSARVLEERARASGFLPVWLGWL